MPLFEARDFGRLAGHAVAGFDRPIPAICYRGEDLKCAVPLGGLATGYFELRPDGKLGLSSIYNSYVPMMNLGGTLLTLIDTNGNVTPLDAEHADIALLPHFPICEVRYAMKNGPVVWLRTLTTMLPGDADGSNTPGVIFEILTDDSSFKGRIRIDLALGHNVEPRVEKREFAGGAARAYFKRDDYRGSIVLAWLDAGDGTATAADDKATFSLTAPLQNGKARRAVLSWHLPWWVDTGGEPHLNRYASRFKDAVEVAGFLLTNHASILARTLAWQRVIYDQQPDWLANALIQSLYSHAKNTVWVDERRPDRWYEPDGLFVHSESFRGCPIAETMVCRQHGHISTLLLWPELERTTLAAFAHFQNRQGEIPFSLGQPNALRDPRFHCQHPLTSSQFVQQMHRYYARTGDEAFLTRLWPSIHDAIKYCAFLDSDNDGLINEHAHALPGDNWPANQFYDQWPWHGTSSYVAGTGLAAMRAYSVIADMLGQHDEHAWAMTTYTRGMNSFGTKLYNGSYFRLWHDDKLGNNETCLANQLMGQWCCRIAGLVPLVDKETCQIVFSSIEKFNAAPTKFGLINGGNFQGDSTTAGDPNNNHGVMIFIGENLCAAMTGMYEGHAAAEEWAKTMVMTIHEHEAMPFDQHCLIRHDNGAPAWGNDYYSNLVVWALPMSRQKIGLAEFCRRGGFVDALLAAGKGQP